MDVVSATTKDGRRASLQDDSALHGTLPKPVRIAFVVGSGMPLTTQADGPSCHVHAVVEALARRGVLAGSFFGCAAGPGAPSEGARGGAATGDVAGTAGPYLRADSPLRRLKRWLPQSLWATARDVQERRFDDALGRRARGFLARVGATVVYERNQYGYSAVSRVCRQRDLPYVLEYNETPELAGEAEGVRSWLYRGKACRERDKLMRAERVFCITDALRRALWRWAGPDVRAEVVHNAVEPEPILAGGALRSAIRERYGLGERFAIGFVGRFAPFHKVDWLLDAAERDGRRDWVYLLVGDGAPATAQLRAEAARRGLAGKVVFTGQVAPAEVPGCLAAMDVGVLPGAPAYSCALKLLEYGAAGLPIVAPSLPGHRELLEDGAVARLFPAGDLAGLVAALASVADATDRGRGLGLRFREKVLREHTWAAVADRVISVCADVLESRARRTRTS